jgi:rhodanese-related sulfurtransferase
MKLFDFLESSDINRDVEQYRQTEGALLLDVRGADEYAEGHIPGSVNIPLQLLPMKKGLPEDLDTPIFVYCRSGGRSRRAAAFLEKEGYENVKNIGGIMNWNGEIER